MKKKMMALLLSMVLLLQLPPMGTYATTEEQAGAVLRCECTAPVDGNHEEGCSQYTETTGSTESTSSTESTGSTDGTETTGTTESTESIEATGSAESTGETEATKSYFETLMEQTTWRGLFDAIMADADAAMVLTEKQILGLESFLTILPDPGENGDEQTAQEEVLSTIQMLKDELGLTDCTCGTEREEHDPECPKFVPVKDGSTYGTYPIWIGGVQITDANLTISGTTGTATYNPATNVLTLDNFTYSGEGYKFSGYNHAAIYVNGDLTIRSLGSSKINATNSNTTTASAFSVYGIYSTGMLTFVGKNLEVIAGNRLSSLNIDPGNSRITDWEWDKNSVGIFGTVVLKLDDDGVLTARSGNGEKSIAIEGSVTTNSGLLKVIAGSGEAASYGIEGSTTIQGSSNVYAESHDGHYYSKAIVAFGDITIDTTGKVEAYTYTEGYKNGNTNNRKSEFVVAIDAANGTLSIIDGEVIGETRRNNSSIAPAHRTAVGIRGEKIIITGGRVWARADETLSGRTLSSQGFWGSYGICGNTLSVRVAEITTQGAHYAFGVSDTYDMNVTIDKDCIAYKGASESSRLQFKVVTTEDKTYAYTNLDEYAYIVGTYPIWVEGIQVTCVNKDDVLGDKDDRGAVVYYVPRTNILYLENYTYKDDVHFESIGGQNISAGLFAKCDLTIQLIGTNTVGNSETVKDRFNAGTYITGNANFIGEGSLTSTGGSSSLYSIGIYNGIHGDTDSVLTFEDRVKVTANAGNSENHNSGIRANGTVEIAGDANVTASGAKSEDWESNGIYAIKDIIIADQANVTAAAGQAKGMSSGIFCEGDIIETGGWTAGTGNVTITTSGTVTATGGKTLGGAAYKVDAEGHKPGSHSRGIFARNTLSISAGTVNAFSGDTRNDVGETNGSHALDAHNEIIIKGTAKVVSTGGPSSGTSTGMSGHKISILDNASVNSQGVPNGGRWNVGIAGQAKDNNTVPAQLLINTTGTVTASGQNCDAGSGNSSIGAHIAGHVVIKNSPNVTFTGNGKGLYASVGNVGSITIDNSTVTASSGTGNSSDGIQANQTISITNSQVTSTAGTATGRSAAIDANWGITISNSTVHATSTAGGTSYGIFSVAGQVTIDGGTVNATGGEASEKTYGIYAGNKVEISNAKEVKATGGTSTYEGDYNNDNAIINQRNYQSGGIVGINEISITNSKVTATGGTNKTGPTWGLLGTTITIDGGTVDATGGHSPRFYSAGIAARNDGTDGTPTAGELTIRNATVTAETVEIAGNQSQPIYAWVDISIYDSTVTSTAAPSGSHNTGILASTGNITIDGSNVEATANNADVNYSIGILAAEGIINITDSIVTSLAGKQGLEKILGDGIHGTKLNSNNAVIFTNSVVVDNETWENTILYRDKARSGAYYGELRDDDNNTVDLKLAHSIDSDDILIVKAEETLNLGDGTNGLANIANEGTIYVNYTGMIYGVRNGIIYYEIVNAIKKTSDDSLAALIFDGSDVTDFTPFADYVAGTPEKERDYAKQNATVTVSSLEHGRLAYNVNVWKNNQDVQTSVTGADTFKMPPYTNGECNANDDYIPQPVKLVGQLLQHFDLIVTKEIVKLKAPDDTTQDYEPDTAAEDLLFLFQIQSKENNDTLIPFTIKIEEGESEGSITLKDLPYGTYTITEDLDWSWRYSPVEESTKEITFSDNNVTFRNQKVNDQWLDSNYSAKNIFN